MALEGLFFSPGEMISWGEEKQLLYLKQLVLSVLTPGRNLSYILAGLMLLGRWSVFSFVISPHFLSGDSTDLQ